MSRAPGLATAFPVARHMSDTFVRTAHAVAVTLVVLALPLVTLHGDAPAPDVTIRIYDTVGIDARIRTAGIRLAADIAAEAGVYAAWLDCSRGGAEYPCRQARGARELIVRLVFSDPVDRRPARSAVSTLVPPGADLRLGFASVESPDRGGVLATIHYANVMRVASRAGIPYTDLLGRAVAHEVGHLLLGETGHSESGLMRAMWTDAELIRNRREDWVFAPSDRPRLQAGVFGPAAPAAAVAALR